MVREYCRYGNTYCYRLTKDPTKTDYEFIQAYPHASCIVAMYKFDKIYKKTLKDTFSAYFAKFAQKGPSLTVKSGFYNKLIFEKMSEYFKNQKIEYKQLSLGKIYELSWEKNKTEYDD
jgi:hypothetical protein